MTIYTSSNPPPGFYVYAYLRMDFSPYYIGKGQGKRAWSKQHSVHLPKDPFIVIMESNLTEIGAFSIERFYIRWYGRKDNGTGILRNLTDGGEGISGIIRSKETRQKISKSHLGKKLSIEHRLSMSKSFKGRTPWNKGKTLSGDPYIPSPGKGRGKGSKGYKNEKTKSIALDKVSKGIHNFQLQTNPNEITITCPHCGKSGSKPGMIRWHFAKCRERE